MSVNSVNYSAQQSGRNNHLGLTAASTAIGLVVGGIAGYKQNPLLDKNKLFKDEFVAKVAAEFEPTDALMQRKIHAAASDFIKICPDPEMKLAEHAHELALYNNVEPELQKIILESIDIPQAHSRDFQNFLKKHAEVIGIYPEEGQTLDDAVKNYMRERPKEFLNQLEKPKEFLNQNFPEYTSQTYSYLDIISKVDKKNGQRIPANNAALRLAIQQDIQAADNFFIDEVKRHNDRNWVADIMDSVFDRKSGKFKQASEEAPQELINSIKKVAEKLCPSDFKWKNAALYGGLAALTMGVTTFISAKIFGKNS